MDRDQNGLLVKFVDFFVRNDKDQGILIEKFVTDNNEYFFKKHQQPLMKHCQQIQSIVRLAAVQRTKKINVDIGPFQYEYFRGNIATFKGCPLVSVNRQIDKICSTMINKEIGAMKRAATLEQNKQRKIDEKNDKILKKIKDAEDHFQLMRAKRLSELFGQRNAEPQASTSAGTSQGSGNHTAPIIQSPRIVARVPPQGPPPSHDDDPMNAAHSDSEY